ncbi:MAG TPA: hypothetical protein VGN56_02655 [Candidatus Paceibacterota bacterium]|jgi:hypothetical protein|nr:hypothetical protein [Candidatus Paceibacterota bacterium]
MMTYRTANRHSMRFIFRRFARTLRVAFAEAFEDLTVTARTFA